MIRNKKGQAILAGIMIAILVFITLVVLIDPIKEVTGIAKDENHLDCSNTSISTGEKATCVISDLYLPYFFGLGMAAALAYVIGRKAVQLINQE